MFTRLYPWLLAAGLGLAFHGLVGRLPPTVSAHPAGLSTPVLLAASRIFPGPGPVAVGTAPPLPAPVPAAATSSAAPAPMHLTDPAGLDGFPHWAPDGRQLVFMRDGDIWVLSTATGSLPARDNLRRLTDGTAAWDVAPVWSPDGTHIAYISYPSDGVNAGPSELRLISARGGKPRTLVRDNAPMGYAAWSPDGSRLAYTSGHQVQMVDLASGAQSQVADLGAEAELLTGGLAWSPDGRHLALGVGRRDDNLLDAELFLVPVDGGEPRQLTTGGGIMPDFSPDGRRLVYRSQRLARGIHILDLASGQSRLHLPDSQRLLYFHPRWSADGKSLVLSQLDLGTAGSEGHLISAIVVLR